MSQSAVVGGREAKRLETSRRIIREAAALTHERGLDGWTMEDLAAAADVSRRTLFNYYSSKIDAVIGPMPTLPTDALATFRAGGPTGDLLDDAGVVVHALLAEDAGELDHRSSALRRQILVANPRLLLVVHERFEEVSAAMSEHLLVRDPTLGAARARLFVRLLAALLDGCLLELADEDEEPRPLTEAFDQAVADARLLLG